MLSQDCTEFPTEIFSSSIQVVRAVAKRPNILGEPDTRLQFGFQEVAFVQKQHKFDVCQKLIAAYGLPEKDAVFQSINTPILRQSLIKTADWGKEQYRVNRVEKLGPGWSVILSHRHQ